MAAIALAVLSAAYLWRSDNRPHVVLIVVDTLRADRLGAYGSARPLTPFIDSLAAKGTVFRHAFATSSWTCPSVASLLTSRFPSQHHVTSFQSALSEDELTVGEILRAAGWAPGAYLANWRLLSSLGYGQGFRRWWVLPMSGEKVRGDQLRAQSAGWLRFPWPQPRFLYMHYMEPHSPYDPPEPHRSRWACAELQSVDVGAINNLAIEMSWKRLAPREIDCLASLYDGEVAAVDAELRRLFDELEQRGFLANAIVVLTADHGEEFNEHGRMLHGFTLYEEMVHVPLLIVAPGLAPGVVEDNVSIVDVAPTLLELLGLPAEARFEGRSLVPLMRAAGGGAPSVPDDQRQILLELYPAGASHDTREHLRGLRQGKTKLLERPNGVLSVFDLAADPLEQRPNAVPFWRRLQQRLSAATTRLQTDLGQRAGTPVVGEAIDEATREKLRALGYHF